MLASSRGHRPPGAPLAGPGRADPRVRFLPMLGYLLVGYLANNILPARLGELVRSHYLGDREGISRASALGTVVVERVVDTAVVVAHRGDRDPRPLRPRRRGQRRPRRPRGDGSARHRAGRRDRRPPAARARTGSSPTPSAGRGSPSSAGASGTAWPSRAVRGRSARPIALSVAAWGATLLAFAAAGQSIGLELTIGEAALLASGVALATAIPSAPGLPRARSSWRSSTIGRALGLPSDQAFALGFLVHVVDPHPHLGRWGDRRPPPRLEPERRRGRRGRPRARRTGGPGRGRGGPDARSRPRPPDPPAAAAVSDAPGRDVRGPAPRQGTTWPTSRRSRTRGAGHRPPPGCSPTSGSA